jgi:hypothetical protein
MPQTPGFTECGPLEVESRFSYPGMVFFYPCILDRDKLKTSLARVLNDFPQYAGKFVTNGVRLRIQHGAGAVSFETKRIDAPIAALAGDVHAGRSRTIEPRVSKFRILLSREVALAIRLTEARDGCALAVAWNHAVGDTHSTMLLMRAWADAYAGRSYEKPIFMSDRDAHLRSVLPDPSGVRSAARRESWSTAITDRLTVLRPATRFNIEFSSTQLAALRKSMLWGSRRVTINDAVCAHVYTVLRRLSGATESRNLCLVVNYRKRIGLSDRLVGNMISLLSRPVDEVDNPAQIAADIRAGLENYATKHANYHATMRVYDANDRFGERACVLSRQFKPGSGDILITNWNNFGLYDLAFGSSKPFLYEPLVLGATRLPEWVMIVYDRPQSMGLSVAVGLPHSVAKRCSSPEGQLLLQSPLPPPDSPRLQTQSLREPAYSRVEEHKMLPEERTGSRT